jgi:hypothetical protein
VSLGTIIAVLTPSPTAAAAIQAAVIVLLVTTNGFLAPPPPVYLEWVYLSSYLGYGAPLLLLWGLGCPACSSSGGLGDAGPPSTPATCRQPHPDHQPRLPMPPPPTHPPTPVAAGYAALVTNEFAGLTLVGPDGEPVTLSGPPQASTPHAGWSLGAIMGMQAGQWAAFWAAMYLSMAMVARLRRL